MKVRAVKYAVTKTQLVIGFTIDYGGALRFGNVRVELEDLVDSDLYGRLGTAAMRKADREYREWEMQQDALFD